MANKQETKRDKKEEITKENVEVSQKNETKNVKAKKVTTKKENMQAKENKTDTGKKKSEGVSTTNKTKSTGTKKNNKANNTNKVETNSKKTTKATGKVNKNSNGTKNESTKSESKEAKVENKKDKNKKVVTKKESKKNLEKNDTEIDEENAVTEVKEEVVKLEEIKSTLNKKNKIPKEKLEEIYGLIFKNIAIAAVIFLNLGQMNIKTDIDQTDLKVFSITSLLISIVLFEKAYKKDSGEIAIYGIETLMLAIITLTLIYINLMFSSRYVFIVNSISCIFAIYYLIKSVIIYIKKRKKCYIDDMKEIINKEEE